MNVLVEPAAIVTLPIAKGIKAYATYFNDQGGVHGRKLEILAGTERENLLNEIIEKEIAMEMRFPILLI